MTAQQLGPRTKAVLVSNLLPEEVVMQMRRWGCLPRLEEGDTSVNPAELTPEDIRDILQEALESGGITELRDTDLDIVKAYVRDQKKARLYVPTEEGSTTHISVSYYKTPLGEYVIPWRNEDLRDLMLDPSTYLKIFGEEPVYFTDVRDLYFGEQKAFVVCVPR